MHIFGKNEILNAILILFSPDKGEQISTIVKFLDGFARVVAPY